MLALAFGISSLVFSIVAIFVPVFGVFIAGVIFGILAWMSVGKSYFLGLAAVIINISNILLLSPTFMALIALEASQLTLDESRILKIWTIVLAIQVIAVFLFIFNIVMNFAFKKGYLHNLFKVKKNNASDSRCETTQNTQSEGVRPFNSNSVKIVC